MSSRSTQIIGGSARQHAHVDGVDNSLAAIGEIHFNIHRGIVFTAVRTELNVANNGTVDVLVVVTNATHLRFRMSAEGQSTIGFFEGTTVSGSGTVVPARNRNRFSSNVATTAVYHTPTITDDGTELVQVFIPGGSGGNAQGAATSPTEEWILSAGNYMVRLTNISGVASNLSALFEFYEPGLLPE